MAKGSPIAVGVDLGMTSITAVVLELREGRPLVIGVGQASGTGLHHGAVVHLDKAVDAIRKAVEEAEIMSSTEIREVYTTVPGSCMQGIRSEGMVEVRGREVRRDDVRRVLAAARAVAIPQERQVIHVVPQQYIVDGLGGLQDPEGMSGVCLEARVHLITAPTAALEHTSKAFQRAGLEVKGVMVQSIAAAEAVLTADEKELGVAVLSLGGGTTELAVYRENALAHTAVFPLGGDALTGDLAQALKTVREEAERLKLKYGCALADAVDPEERVTIPAVGGRPPMEISRQYIAEVLESRLEEILALVYQELQGQGLSEGLTGGVVLTGGSALLRGVDELAAEVLELPVRFGSPSDFDGLGAVVRSPKFATAVGLALAAARGGPEIWPRLEPRGGVRQIWKKTVKALADFF